MADEATPDHESTLIGSILSNEASDDHASVTAAAEIGAIDRSIGPHTGKSMIRATSAPPAMAPPNMQATDQPAPGHAETTPEDGPDGYRLSAEYYNYYYSQRPLDPRLPVPLFNWSAWNKGGPEAAHGDAPPHGRMAAGSGQASDKPAVSGQTPVGETDAPGDLQVGDVADHMQNLSLHRNTSGQGAAHGPVLRQAQYQGFPSMLQHHRPQQQDDPQRSFGPAQGGFAAAVGVGGPSIAMFQQGPQYRAISVGASNGTPMSPLMAVMGYGPTHSPQGLQPMPPPQMGMMPTGSMKQGSVGAAGMPLYTNADGSASSPSSSGPSLGESHHNSAEVSGQDQQNNYVGQYMQPYTQPPMYAAARGDLDGGYGQAPWASQPQQMPQQYYMRGPHPLAQGKNMQAMPPAMGWAQAQVQAQTGQQQQQQQQHHMHQWMDNMSGGARGEEVDYGHGQHHYQNNQQQHQQHPQQQQQHQGSYPRRGTYGIGSSVDYNASSASASLRARLKREEDLTGSSATRRWIDDLRLNKGNSSYSLMHVVKHNMVVDLASDQYGSRFIQQRLETAADDEKQAAFQQLLPEVYALCKDVFGNYVIQKFLEKGLADHRTVLVRELLGNVLDLSLQMYGCRVVQKAIDVSDTQQQALLVRELVGHVMQCVKDQNGNHVVQKCIEKVPAPMIQFIVDSFKGQVFNLSTHPYGCRVIQRLLEHCSEEQRNAILEEILHNTQELCKNQYGNYVVQHVLIHGTPWHRGAIIQSLRGSLVPLSRHKFASNVVEKCFAHANRQDRGELVNEVLGREDDPNCGLVLMVQDQFANYVVQKIIDVVDQRQREAIVHRLRAHVPHLRKLPYGKHIISRIERITGKAIFPGAPLSPESLGPSPGPHDAAMNGHDHRIRAGMQASLDPSPSRMMPVGRSTEYYAPSSGSAALYAGNYAER